MLFDYRKFKTFMFDLDGTVWNWTTFIPGAKYVLEKLHSRHKKIYYVTNNTILSREGIAKKLTLMGVKTQKEQVITSGYTAAKYFELNGIDKVYMIGEHGFAEELSEHGVSISQRSSHVVVATDRTFNYSKLKIACDLIRKGASLYTVGENPLWKVGAEQYPAELPIIAAIVAATGAKPMRLGKPSDHMKKRILEDIFLFPEDSLFIGDRLSDIEFARKCGFRSALFVNEVSMRKEDLKTLKEEEKPDTIISDFSEILHAF